jgi:hypothetical protein
MENRVELITGRFDSESIRKNRKENHFYKELALISIDDVDVKPYLVLRLYGTSRVNYACLWSHGMRDGSVAGGGSAGGYGYCRESAAAAEAIARSGIVLQHDISGRGMDAVVDALEAIARYVGLKRYYIHQSNA